MSELYTGDRFDGLRASIDASLVDFADTNPAIAAVDRGTSDDTVFGNPRWYVRMIGDDKDYITVWLTLGQRMLRHETYVMPAPEDNSHAVLDLLLRRNHEMVGASFSIGDEEAIYLRGELPNSAIDTAELDRLLGTVWTIVDGNFRRLLQLGFASRFS